MLPAPAALSMNTHPKPLQDEEPTSKRTKVEKLQPSAAAAAAAASPAPAPAPAPAPTAIPSSLTLQERVAAVKLRLAQAYTERVAPIDLEIRAVRDQLCALEQKHGRAVEANNMACGHIKTIHDRLFNLVRLNTHFLRGLANSSSDLRVFILAQNKNVELCAQLATIPGIRTQDATLCIRASRYDEKCSDEDDNGGWGVSSVEVNVDDDYLEPKLTSTTTCSKRPIGNSYPSDAFKYLQLEIVFDDLFDAASEDDRILDESYSRSGQCHINVDARVFAWSPMTFLNHPDHPTITNMAEAFHIVLEWIRQQTDATKE